MGFPKGPLRSGTLLSDWGKPPRKISEDRSSVDTETDSLQLVNKMPAVAYFQSWRGCASGWSPASSM
jgi:hypothetical protein